MAQDLETRRAVALHAALSEWATRDYLREQLSCTNAWDREVELGQAESEFDRSQPERLRNQAQLHALRDDLSIRREKRFRRQCKSITRSFRAGRGTRTRPMPAMLPSLPL
jgi:hypothetical protein